MKDKFIGWTLCFLLAITDVPKGMSPIRFVFAFVMMLLAIYYGILLLAQEWRERWPS